MQQDQFSNTLMVKGIEFLYPLLAKNVITTTEEIVEFVSISAYSVYDRLDGDLNRALMLDQVMSASSITSDMMTHLRHFLRSCLSSHIVSDNNHYVTRLLFSATPSIQEQKWEKVH